MEGEMNDVKFMVCPHDTASDPDKWFQLAQFLSKKLNASIQFHKCLDFTEFHEQLKTGSLIYANPQDSLRLIKEDGYTAIARASNLFDEITFIARDDVDNPKMGDFQNEVVVSVNSMMVTRVGAKYLLDRSIVPKQIQSKSSWMAVVKGIYRGEDKFGLVYKDFYDGLNALTKSGFKTVGQTADGTIHHSVLVSPELKGEATRIQQCLVSMHQLDDRGQQVLDGLGVTRFISVDEGDILQFESLLALGNELMGAN